MGTGVNPQFGAGSVLCLPEEGFEDYVFRAVGIWWLSSLGL